MIPFSFYNISFISTVGLYENQLRGTLPANVSLTLPNLQLLEVGDNDFFGSIPGSLCNASQLQVIDLVINNFAGPIPTCLGNLLNLERLTLGRNNLGRELAAS